MQTQDAHTRIVCVELMQWLRFLDGTWKKKGEHEATNPHVD